MSTRTGRRLTWFGAGPPRDEGVISFIALLMAVLGVWVMGMVFGMVIVRDALPPAELERLNTLVGWGATAALVFFALAAGLWFARWLYWRRKG